MAASPMPRLRVRLPVWTALAAFCLPLLAVPPARPGPARTPVYGYYCVYCQYQSGWHEGRYSVQQIAASGALEHLTKLYYAFGRVANNRCEVWYPEIALDQSYGPRDSVSGKADRAGPGHLRGIFHQLQELKRRYPRLKIIMSLGGWGLSGGFPSAAAPAHRQVFVRSCVRMFIQGHFAPGITAPGIFDGLDIDWEFPVAGGTAPGTPADTRNLTALAAEFRRQLDAVRPGLWLSAALPNNLRHFDVTQLSRYMNDLAVMSYDMMPPASPVTGFGSALFHDPAAPPAAAPPDAYAAYAVQKLLAAGVPAAKIVLGVPFGDGGFWTGVSDRNHGLYQPAAPFHFPKPPAGAALGPHIFPGLPAWDRLPPSADRQYWPRAGSCSAWYQGKFWTYDCPRALRAKAAYARAHHLGGVMFWDLEGDLTGKSLAALASR